MSNLQIGELLALATALLWTLSALAWTAAGKRIGALAVSFIRLVIAVGLMAVYSRVVSHVWWPSGVDGRAWLVLGASGIFGFFLCDICLFKSMLLLGTRSTLLLYSLAPPITAVISWMFTNDPLVARQWVAMGVTLAGVVWVLVEQPDESEQAVRADGRWRGIVLGVFAAAAGAVGYVLAKQGVGGYDPVSATQIRALASLPAYVALITLNRRWPVIRAAVCDAKVMGILTFGATVGPFIGVTACMAAFRLAPAGIVAMLVATMPVLILPFSVFLHRERVSLRAVVGAFVAVAGVALLMGTSGIS